MIDLTWMQITWISWTGRGCSRTSWKALPLSLGRSWCSSLKNGCLLVVLARGRRKQCVSSLAWLWFAWGNFGWIGVPCVRTSGCTPKPSAARPHGSICKPPVPSGDCKVFFRCWSPAITGWGSVMTIFCRWGRACRCRGRRGGSWARRLDAILPGRGRVRRGSRCRGEVSSSWCLLQSTRDTRRFLSCCWRSSCVLGWWLSSWTPSLRSLSSSAFSSCGHRALSWGRLSGERGKASFATKSKACSKNQICCVFVLKGQLMFINPTHCCCPNRWFPTLLDLFFCWFASVSVENCAFE